MAKNRKLMFFGFLFIFTVLVYSCQPQAQEDNNDRERILEQQIAELREALRQAQLSALNQPAVLPPPSINQRPEILVTEPDPGENIQSDNFLVRWTASDRDNDQLLITLEFRRENSASFVPIASLISNSGQFIWDVSGITDGAFTLKATVTDGELEDSFTTGVFSINRN